MDELFIQNANSYAAKYNRKLAERLGFGIRGIIFAAEDKLQGGHSAIKAHREDEPYLREKAVYLRLQQVGVGEILEFKVPELIQTSDELRVIEMSIVRRPFVLDFAGAYLDAPPDFPEEIWNEWESEKQEQFEGRWEKVRAILDFLESLEIYMIWISGNWDKLKIQHEKASYKEMRIEESK